MFRISQYMKTLKETPHPPSPSPSRGEGLKKEPLAPPLPLRERGTGGEGFPGPVVIWNLIRRCNLLCKHCYSVSADTDFPNELNRDEISTVMDDLYQFGVRVLILSGGEPLLHPNIFSISREAKAKGFYVGLSTNGTRISRENIGQIADTRYNYVGISIDGMRAVHDQFRRKEGAFDEALNGIRLCREHGIKVGLRFTMTEGNAAELPELLKLMDDEGIGKFYFSHLNYAGRGNKNRREDASFRRTRQAMDLLFDTCWGAVTRGEDKEFVTGNNDADGVYLLHWVRQRFPAQEALMRRHLQQWGGNSSGVNIANIDNQGNVHPDTMWWNYTLGNVRERPFSEIWMDTSDPLMAGLKTFPRRVKGRCASCAYFGICGGNTRTRAWQTSGDFWAEDPGCYLDDREISRQP